MAKKRHLRRLEIALGDLEEFDIIYDTFIWDVICAFRKFGRFTVRVFQWIPVLWNDEDWDFAYLLYILKFKLEKIEKALKEDDLHLHADRRARQARVVIEHLNRYLDIDKYTIDNDIDEFLGNSEDIPCKFDEDGKPTLYRMSHKDDKLHKKHMRVIKHQDELEQWHWKEFWRKLSKYGQGWWV